MSGTETAAKPRHPVRIVVARTGLTPDLLRIWERRYGAVRPDRSDGRHRLYSDADIERLRLLAQLTESGVRIRKVATLSASELRANAAKLGVDREAPDARVPAQENTRPNATLAAALEAVERFDAVALDGILRHAAQRLGADDTIDSLVQPLLTAIGDRWHKGTLTVANEHLASAVVRSALSSMKDQVELAPTAPLIAIGTPQGQVHEIGALIAALSAATRGWRVVYLGSNLPADEIVKAATRTGCRAIALSIVFPFGDASLRTALLRLSRTLPRGMKLVLGGAAATSYAKGLGSRVVTPTDLGAFRTWLERTRRAYTRSASVIPS
jgi:methanogenic corrinoid protein MtbC1